MIIRKRSLFINEDVLLINKALFASDTKFSALNRGFPIAGKEVLLSKQRFPSINKDRLINNKRLSVIHKGILIISKGFLTIGKEDRGNNKGSLSALQEILLGEISLPQNGKYPYLIDSSR